MIYAPILAKHIALNEPEATTRKAFHWQEIKLKENGKTSAPVQIGITGQWEHPVYGQFRITKQDLEEIVKNFNDGKREVVFDYQHSSQSPDHDEAIAAGWITALELRENKGVFELWATVRWTEKARERIESGEYRFTSPEIAWEYPSKDDGKILGTVLLACALTNRPFLEGMKEVTLKEGVVLVKYSSLQESETQTEVSCMFTDAQVRKILGLAESVEVTDDHRTKASEKLLALHEASESADGNEDGNADDNEVSEDAEDENADGEEGETVTLTEFRSTQKELAEVRKELAERKADEMVDKAVDDGKVLPSEVKALKETAKSGGAGFALVAKQIASRPKLVDLSERGSDEQSEDAADPKNTEADAKKDWAENSETYKKMGLSEQDLIDNYKFL